jgi:hypothetical protein
MSDFNTKAARTARVALVLALAGTGLVVTAGSSSALSVAATLSATTGPSGGGNTITATTTTAKFFTGTVVEFQYSATAATACTAFYAPIATLAASPAAGVIAVSGTAVKVLSSTKLAITVPSTLALPTPATSFNFNVCVYPGTSGTTSAVLANAKYAIAAAPTIAATGSVAPAGGPALGLGPITVTGTNFLTGLTATLGGQPIGNITVVGPTTFTGTAPAHAAGPVSLSVTTTGGTQTKSSAYTYSDGLVVSPQTAPQGTSTVLDVAGVGFSTKTFVPVWDGAANDDNAHVYLVPGAYDASGTTAKANGEVAECANVLVISDTELLCTLDTSNSYTSVQAAADARTAADAVTAASSTALTSALNAAFVAGDVGATVTGVGIPAGTIISSITSGTAAVMSAQGTGVSSPVGVQIGVGPVTRAASDGITAAGSKALTSLATALFTQADVGAAVYGAGIPAGTTITAVTAAVSPATTSSAVLSQNATAVSATGVWIGVPVANGTYTVTTVAHGTIASAAAPSIISSTSTFTVSAY